MVLPRPLAAVAVVCLLPLLACSPPRASEDEGMTTTTNGATESQGSETESETGFDTLGTSESSTTDEATGTETETETETETDTWQDFVIPPDVPPIDECDVFAQDCPEGDKCVPGFGMGAEPSCVPVTGDGATGQPCTPGPDGDDCDADNLCLAPMMAPEGLCVPFCSGTPIEPVCPDGMMCIAQVGACIGAACNPLVPDACPDGWPCLGRLGTGGARCSFAEGASYGLFGVGESCASNMDCAEGSACTVGAAVPDCMDEYCCTAWCDPTDPDACMAQPGTSCATGMMNPGYGRCVL